MDNITFDQLPAAVSQLLRDVNSIKLSLQANSTEPVDEFLTVEQASVFISKAKPTIYAMLSRGELPNLKRGGRVYFLKSDLIEYLKAGRRKTYAQLAEEGRR